MPGGSKRSISAENPNGVPVTREEKAASRKSLNISEARPLAVFIGSIGHDRRKGFDILLEAWRRLCADPQWDVDLLVAGSGSALGEDREQVAQWKLEHRIRMLGFSDRVRDLSGRRRRPGESSSLRSLRAQRAGSHLPGCARHRFGNSGNRRTIRAGICRLITSGSGGCRRSGCSIEAVAFGHAGVGVALRAVR